MQSIKIADYERQIADLKSALDEANADRAANRNETERLNQKRIKEAGKTVALEAFCPNIFLWLDMVLVLGFGARTP